MSDKNEGNYNFGGNNGFINYLRRYRTVEVCAQFFRHRIEPNSDILDCGCGPGSVTLGLAEWALAGRTIGIDLDCEQFDIARALAEAKGISNIDFQKASIFQLPFENDQFDIVFAQALFAHIPQHSEAIREIHRVLKPGGYVAIRDIVSSLILISPAEPMAEKLRFIYCQGMIYSGGNPDVGLSLGRLLLDNNFDQLELSVDWEQSPNCDFRTEYFANLVDVVDNGKLGKLAVGEGWITATEKQEISQSCRNLANNPAAMWGLPFVQALAQKSWS